MASGVFDRDILFVKNDVAKAADDQIRRRKKERESGRGERLYGDVSGNWSINGNPNGGYLMGILAKAILDKSEKGLISIFTANFISRCQAGKAALSIRPTGATRRFERWRGALFSSGEQRMQVMATLSDMGSGDNRYEKSPPDLAPLDDCLMIPEIPGYTIFTHMDARLDPDCSGWIMGELSEVSEQKGWIRFRDDRPFDQASLMMIADAFPPASLATQGMAAWVPTLELSVNIRDIPKTKWLKCRFRSRFNTSGIVEEDGEIWDEDGRLIAISRQISNLIKDEKFAHEMERNKNRV